MKPRIVPVVLAGFAAAEAARSQTLLHDLPQGGPVAGLPDLDGDGANEFAVDRVVYSGADASVLLDVSALGPASAVRGIDDLDGDGQTDLVFGRSFFTYPIPQPVIQYVSTADGAVLGTMNWSFFDDQVWFLDAAPDTDGDGLPNVVLGGPSAFWCDSGSAFVFDAFPGGEVTALSSSDAVFDGAFVGDVNGDGLTDVAVIAESGCGGERELRLYRDTNGPIVYPFATAKVEWPAASVSAIGDFDADGTPDVLANSPSIVDTEQVEVRSGADPAVVLLQLPGAGFRVGGPGDIDCDGTPDVLAAGGAGTRLFSGADASMIWSDPVTAYKLEGAGDVNGDGAPDWIVSFSGRTQVWAGPGPSVATYCTGKTTSAGCTPAIDTSGLPTATGPDDFLITTRSSLAGKSGLFFWGTTGALAVPFLGGTLCVQPPLQRGPILVSQGPADCQAGYAFLASQAWAQEWQVASGVTVHGQFWMRDPDHPDGTGVALSNGVEFGWCD